MLPCDCRFRFTKVCNEFSGAGGEIAFESVSASAIVAQTVEPNQCRERY